MPYLHPSISCCVMTHLSSFSATCRQACGNGGRCTAPNFCTCSSGWSGASCEIGKIQTATFAVAYHIQGTLKNHTEKLILQPYVNHNV